MTFQTTRWSLILRARQPGERGEQALGELLGAYWQPVYVFYRRLGASRDDAADLTQGLFTDLLARGDLASAEPGRGRFRTFLRSCARHWWSNERARAATQKRGGAALLLPLDPDDAEAWLATQPVDTMDPEALFERRWACTVIDRAIWQLEQDELAAGRREQFAVLRAVLDGSPPRQPWAELARSLDSTEGALKVAAHRLKARFRDLLAAEVRETLPDEVAAGDELQELLTALHKRAPLS
ncbi:MAG: sigma-70 family RNA polymerase sigma factor [Planctomycetes bacterium]|nr:sigma-70 family RNA polymerase sigma factor [Planctomycetota bacterium]